MPTSHLAHYLTTKEIAAIKAVKVGLGGAGGLGSNIAVILTRSGFENFEIIDKDTIEASNLNRQDYTQADIGQPKTEALKKRILSINPSAAVTTHFKTWNEDYGASLFHGCRFIIEAFDEASWKARFIDYYHRKAAFVLSGNGMAGVSTTDLNIRRYGNIFFVGDGQTAVDKKHPPLAPRVVECAAKIAGIILQTTLEG